MRASPSWKSVSASLLLVASLASACSGSQADSSDGAGASRGPTPIPTPETLTAYPSGFPTTFVDDQNPTDPGLLPVDGGLQGNYTGTLSADGTAGTYTATWVENRIPAAKITCKGIAYVDVWTGETPEITMEVEFADWGSAVLVTTGHVVVYSSSRNGSSPAVCEQTTTGTFMVEFSNGPIKKLMSGTWHLDAGGQLVFDPPAPSPSPSQPAG